MTIKEVIAVWLKSNYPYLDIETWHGTCHVHHYISTKDDLHAIEERYRYSILIPFTATADNAMHFVKTYDLLG